MFSCLSFSLFDRPKRDSNSTQLCLFRGIFEQIKPLPVVGKAAEFKIDSKLEPLPFI